MAEDRRRDAANARVLLLHASDDVAIALEDVSAGTVVSIPGSAQADVRARDDIPRGHKIAIRDLQQDDPVRKYGEIIGFASEPIAAGAHVHIQNLVFRPFERSVTPLDSETSSRPVSPAFFRGYRRDDGRVGTRNYVGIMTTVNCSATVARTVSRHFQQPGALDGYPNVDGVVALTHSLGCCMDGGGLGLLRRTLEGYARHPNFGAILVLGLGCEQNEMSPFLTRIEGHGVRPADALVIQELGGTTATIEGAIASVARVLPVADRAQRTEVPASELIVAMECGGSDAFSGLTANPVVGAAGDLVARHGGTYAFGETPEIYGAEHLLMRRAAEPAVAERLRERIRWWERYVAVNGGSMDNNPTPGNKEGGISTILEKSLGAIAKGGTTPLAQVCEYAEPMTAKGLVFMDTPGYDPVSVTGLVAGGATVTCFTTGRGSVFGCKPVPSIKVATNTPIYERMTGDMDLNAGRILDGTATVDGLGAELFDLILRVASGEKTKSERLGFGEEEFNPWLIGAVM